MTSLTLRPPVRPTPPSGAADPDRAQGGAFEARPSTTWGLDPRLMTRLVSTADGWALLAYSGDKIFQAQGPDARRRCLLHAFALGVQCMR